MKPYTFDRLEKTAREFGSELIARGEVEIRGVEEQNQAVQQEALQSGTAMPPPATAQTIEESIRTWATASWALAEHFLDSGYNKYKSEDFAIFNPGEAWDTEGQPAPKPQSTEKPKKPLVRKAQAS